MGIFKNESMGIAEWIEHYLWQGADVILLLDNNSTDNYREQIAKFEPSKVVVLPAKKEFAQEEHYSILGLNWLRDNSIDIVAVLDLDEYMYSKDGTQLKTVLTRIFNSSEQPSAITCKWTMYGSSGHTVQPSSIRHSFTWKKSEYDENIKSVYKVKDLHDTISIHTTPIKGPTVDKSDILQINHYAIQSKEFFEKVKMTRGDAAYNKNIRDWNYFEKYDFKDTEDLTLKSHLENTA
jgi:glycosyltransferase involved in cell wall biosynthesis